MKENLSPNNRQNVSWLLFLSSLFIGVGVSWSAGPGHGSSSTIQNSKYLQFEEISSYANEIMNEYIPSPSSPDLQKWAFEGH